MKPISKKRLIKYLDSDGSGDSKKPDSLIELMLELINEEYSIESARSDIRNFT